jgi:hypothetical protein
MDRLHVRIIAYSRIVFDIAVMLLMNMRQYPLHQQTDTIQPPGSREILAVTVSRLSIIAIVAVLHHENGRPLTV